MLSTLQTLSHLNSFDNPMRGNYLLYYEEMGTQLLTTWTGSHRWKFTKSEFQPMFLLLCQAVGDPSGLSSMIIQILLHQWISLHHPFSASMENWILTSILPKVWDVPIIWFFSTSGWRTPQIFAVLQGILPLVTNLGYMEITALRVSVKGKQLWVWGSTLSEMSWQVPECGALEKAGAR